jgi:hypothetical protein
MVAVVVLVVLPLVLRAVVVVELTLKVVQLVELQIKVHQVEGLVMALMAAVVKTHSLIM